MIVILMSLFMSGCGKKYENAYDVNSGISAFTFGESGNDNVAASFAQGLCVASVDISEGADLSRSEASGLFDVVNRETILCKNANEVLYPASLTKTMTAMIALKYGKLDDVLIASGNVAISESGAQLLPLKEGDRMTLEQALHALLMYSANDVGVMIAEYISGSVEEFAALMNKEALSLGATNTNFKNPHGLTDEEHYTTVYDLYLIFNEAIKYEKFNEIINKEVYELNYSDAQGNIKSKELHTTNAYLSGEKNAPEGVRVVGGKTGTTDAAGSCLVLLSNDTSGNPYISVVLKAEDREGLYDQMSGILNNIP
ncbi:MAG: serine hydrolase [Lachnospiraceae bacterium]|nr:serine hydrolase [Lachnospiraceae bacterium]